MVRDMDKEESSKELVNTDYSKDENTWSSHFSIEDIEDF